MKKTGLALVAIFLIVSVALFVSLPQAGADITSFGYKTKGTRTSDLGNISGDRFTCATNGVANSISVYLTHPGESSFTAQAAIYPASGGVLGDTTQESSYADGNIEDVIRGSSFTCPQTGTIQSISAYIECSSTAKMMRAAIYDNAATHAFLAATEEKLVSTGTGWVTFTFTTPQGVTLGNKYVLVIWSSSDSGDAFLYFNSAGSSNQGHSIAYSYSSNNWPSQFGSSPPHNTNKYSIYCTYSGSSPIAITEERTLTNVDGFVTFDFEDKPALKVSTDYVLAVWASPASGATISYVNSGSGEYFSQQGAATYPHWPSYVVDQGNSRTYSIYCTVQNSFTLISSTSGTGSGTITTSPSQTEYKFGSNVELSATPATGSSFSGWSGALTGTGSPQTLTMDADKNVTATFTLNEFFIDITINPSSSAGTVIPDNSGPYHYGDVVTFTASANPGYSFTAWGGDGTTDFNDKRVVTVTNNMTITADFTIGMPSVQSSTSIGAQKDQFIPDETVYATGSGFTANTEVNIYIVIHKSTRSTDNWLSDINGEPTSAITTDNGQLITAAVWINADPGLYDIIVDANKNHVFDEGDAKDSVDISPGGGGFLVVPEYALGGLAAIGACLLGYVAFKKRSNLFHL